MNNLLFSNTLQPHGIHQHTIHSLYSISEERPCLLYVMDGGGSAVLDDQVFHIQRGSIFIIGEEIHLAEIHASEPLNIFSISFSLYCTSLMKNLPAISSRPILAEDNARMHVLSIVQAASKQLPYASDRIALDLQFLLLIIASKLLPPTVPSPVTPTGYHEDAAMGCILQYIQQHLSEEISFQDLISVSGCTPKQVYSLFRHHFQTTPMKYLLNLRIETAKKLLTSTQMNITQISSACGFQTVHYFSHAFKMRLGLSPCAYRNEILECSPSIIKRPIGC